MAFSDVRSFDYAQLGVPMRDTDTSGYVTSGWVKRTLDIAVACLLLLAVWPLLIVIAACLRFSGRPIFDFGKSIGLSGVEFRTISFNSDVSSSFGRFLLSTGISKQPMLVNVVMGDMSLVGPEPKKLEDLTLSNKFTGLYLKARPGMTGRWLVSPERMLGANTRMRLDRGYMQNGTFWEDLSIFFKTPFAFYLNV